MSIEEPIDLNALRAALEAAPKSLRKRNSAPRRREALRSTPAAHKTEQPPADPSRKRIVVTNEQHHILVSEALSTMGGATVYNYGGRPVGIREDEHGAAIRPHDVPSMRLLLSTHADWFRLNTSGDLVATHPPDHVVQGVLAHPAPPFPHLDMLTPAPLMSRDGSVDLTPGYHPSSRTYYAPAPGLVVGEVPERPTPEQARLAAQRLLDPFSEFPFVAEADRANLLAMILQLFARCQYDGPSPITGVTANAAGSGKGLQVESACSIYTPMLSPTPEARDEDEWRKRITSALSHGSPVLWIDNVNHRLESGPLAALVTAPMWEDRVLGSSKNVRLRPPSLVVFTANNPAFSNEIARRVMVIRLDAKMEQPFMRTNFRIRDLVAWVRRHRGELIACVLTMIRAWIVAGRPPGRYHLGSFEAWAATIGGILDVAGVQGFLGNLQEVLERNDSEGDQWRAFVGAWWVAYNVRTVGVSELLELVRRSDLLPYVIKDGTDRQQSTRLGMALAKQQDRVYGGRRIVFRKKDNTGRMQYALEIERPRETESSTDDRRPHADLCRPSYERSALAEQPAKPVSDDLQTFADLSLTPHARNHNGDHTQDGGAAERSAKVCPTSSEANGDAGLRHADLPADLPQTSADLPLALPPADTQPRRHLDW